MTLERLRKLGVKIKVLLVGPVAGAAETADGVLAFHFEVGLIHKLVVNTLHHIQEHMGISTLGECAAHHTHTVARGEFDLRIVIIKQDSIIACLGILVLMLECRPVTRSGIVFITLVEFHLAHDGHKTKITIIRAARAAEVGGAEAEDGVVGGVVARAAVPVVHAGVGAELHHAEGHRGAREGMAVAARPDEGIDILSGIGDVVCLGRLRAGREGQKQ